MRIPLTAIFVIAAALAAFAKDPAPAPAAPKPEAQQLTAFEQQLIGYEKAMPEAQKKKDMDFYKRTLADDFIAVGTDAKVHTRNEIIDDLRAIDLKQYRIYDAHVVPLNESAAVVTYDVIIEMGKYDEETPRYQHISSVWVKQGDQWKLKFQQATAAQ
jgi:hypothetical protein